MPSKAEPNQAGGEALPISMDDVLGAQARIKGRVLHTPALRSETLSRLLSAEIWVKFENLQFTAAFKERGAANCLALLNKEQRRRGVVAMSAGNHAQAVAYHAARLGIAATIVMPRGTPFLKVSRTRDHAARVILAGETLADAARHARFLEASEGLTFVHPYDDAAIIAGQATCAAEFLDDVPSLDRLIVPVGGGGLAAGASIVAAARGGVSVIGVESNRYGALAQRLAGLPVDVGGATIAEGIAVRDIGELPLAILSRLRVAVELVDDRHIEDAITMLVEVEKTVVEGAGAAGLALLLARPQAFAGRRIGLILSGGNIDARMLAGVLLRGLARDERILGLAMEVSDKPGALALITRIVAEKGGNIIELQHQRLFGVATANAARIEMLLEVQDRPGGQALIQALEAAGIRVQDSRRAFNPGG